MAVEPDWFVLVKKASHPQPYQIMSGGVSGSDLIAIRITLRRRPKVDDRENRESRPAHNGTYGRLDQPSVGRCRLAVTAIAIEATIPAIPSHVTITPIPVCRFTAP
jgi:hypothetical protein